MGRRCHSMTYSETLLQSFQEALSDDEYALGDYADMTSTAGYDNDGSTGPELLDNGVGLAFCCRNYHAEAKIFWAVNASGVVKPVDCKASELSSSSAEITP